MRQLDDKTAGTAWHFLTHLIRKFEMKEFAGPITEYLNEKNAGDSAIGIQYGIISTLQALQAKEFDSKIAPYTTSSPALSHVALETLISFKSKKAIPALLAKFADKNSKWWALDKLAEIGALEAAPQIAEQLKDDDENIPYWAIDALVRLNAKAQSKDLWQFLKYSENDRNKGYAVAALIHFGEKEAVTIAIDHLKGIAEGSKDYYVWESIDKLKPKPIYSRPDLAVQH
jgi:HEAT repeat protein